MNICFAAAGALCALAVDAIVGRLFGERALYASLWATSAVAASLGVAGALSVFYFRPLTRKGAFAGGFATVAVLALFIP